MADPVVVSALRSATGRFGGALKDMPAAEIGGKVIAATLAATEVAGEEVDEVMMGMVYQGGAGANPARQAAVNAGLPYEVPSTTVNKLCGSGLKSVGLGAQAIVAGEAEAVLAGGMENMSLAPYVMPGARWGERLGHGQVEDTMLLDGLWDCFYDCHMGITAENLAEEYGISRPEQDEFAARSQDRWAKAQLEEAFKDEIMPIGVATKGGEELFAVDEHPRPGTTAEQLAGLKPAFKPEGTVTAGNASGINDGAAALLLMAVEGARARNLTPLAQIRGSASAGVDPRVMGIGPAPAIRRLLDKTGEKLENIDLIELNEAFAAQSLAVGRELDWDWERVNVQGGAIAMGHAVGASGARIATTLLHKMQREQARLGIAALCIGGGMGIAMLFERAG
ncbi:MAG: acetyl-CoA C-acetyltransferase [Candidatus Latescibacteria bacterium]|nr:acetyl-CoA C-acetyltransferase [Candidatus Latescibacterota bacterium]